MSVHYKFKSAISYDTITFDGLHISVKDLKKSILHQKQIGKNTDFDLQVTNAQTNEEYTDDQTLIPKNTSLIVSRIPLTTQQKKAWERAEQNNQLVLSKQILNLDSHEPDSAKLKGADILGSNASEEDKINAMMAQSTQEYDPSNFVKIRGGNQYGEVPQNYVCHRCHNPGHWIKNCPNNNTTTSDPIDIKKATGIPRGFLVPVAGPTVPGAMLTGLGTFAVPSIDQEAYKQSMKPQKKQETKVEKVIIPEDLLCNLCSDLLTDAIMMPCCGTSFCDECIRNALLESEENECTDCHGKEISPETLIPNRYLRNAVNSFKDKTGYSKRIEVVKEKITPSKEKIPISEINNEPSNEEVIIPASTQSSPPDPSIEVPKDEIYQKIAAVGDSIDKSNRNYSTIGTINNNLHNQSTFKTQSQSQVSSHQVQSHQVQTHQVQSHQGQGPPVSVSNSRPNNTNVHIPINNFQNSRHNIIKSNENRVTHMSRFNSQSLSIPPHHHLRPCLPIGPADISVPPPPFAHPPPSVQSDIGYSQMQPIHNPPPPGLDRNSSPANASSDEGMHLSESTHHQMDKFENQSGTLQPMMRTGYPTDYYPPPIHNYDPYNIPVDMRSRGYIRGYSRRPTRGQQIGSNFRSDYRNGGNYLNNKRTIDDPLAVFQRILRERDNKRRDMRVRHSISRSRSRSLTRSRSRERSRSLSRSPSRIINHRARSISRSPLPLRNRSITPRRRSRTRSRSPVRKRKKTISPIKRLPVKSRRRTRSPSRDIPGRRSRSLSLHRRTRSRSRSLTHRNRISPSLRFRSRSPSFYSSPVRFNNYHREEDNYGPKGGNWRGRGTWNKGNQPYQQSHRYRGKFDGHYDVGIDRPTEYTQSYQQYDPHFAMDPNLVRDWDEIRDKEIREREKEKKEEEDKLKQKSKSQSQSPIKHHKVEKQRQEPKPKPSPEKDHKDSDKKDKGKRKKKKDADVDKKKKKKSKEKKEKDDKKGDDSNNEEIKNETEKVNQSNQEPAAPGTSESPLPFDSVTVKEDVKIKHEEKVADELYGDLDQITPVDTSWGSFKSTERTSKSPSKTIEIPIVESIEEKPKEPEVLAELPERSKWEVEEDGNTTDEKLCVDKQKRNHKTDLSEFHNDNNQVSVTNEVLKRAENAIFQKTVRTLDVSGKKTAGDKSDGTKDKKSDIVREKKIESEKHLGKEKKLDNVKEKKSEVSKEKKIEIKEKKNDTSRDKKIDTVKKQDIIKDKKPDISKDFKDKKTDVDKKIDVTKEKKTDYFKDKKTERDRKSNDKSDNKTGSEKMSRRDDYTSKHKDKKHLESETSLDSSSIQREARKAGNSIQITIPTDTSDDKKNKEVTKRISAKDRLGEKVEDKDDKMYKSRNEKRKSSRSPIRVHSTLIVPDPPRLPRKLETKNHRDSLKKDRNSTNERTTITSHRSSRRDDDKKSDNQQKKSDTRIKVGKIDDKHRSIEPKVVTKKDDKFDKNDEKKKEEKIEETVKKSKPKDKEPEKKERKNRRLEPDHKVNDETPFEPTEEDEDSKKLSKNKESDDSLSSSSSSSSSSDSSPVRSKKRKKTKKRKKKHIKKKKLASSSDSDDSDSSSESDETSSKHKKKKKKEQRKHKVHKKPIKKKKKTKHR